MAARNEKIDGLITVLDTMNALGHIRYEDYTFFHDAINDLRDKEN